MLLTHETHWRVFDSGLECVYNTLSKDMKKSSQKYKFAAVAVDVVVFSIDNGELKVLLIEMKKYLGDLNYYLRLLKS